MLTVLDRVARRYTIALNNFTTGQELAADFDLLVGQPRGEVVFDFRHMAAPLTQEKRDDYLPGSFGYQPTRNLVEAATQIGRFGGGTGPCHKLVARLPDRRSKVGGFLHRMQLAPILRRYGVAIQHADPASPEFGEDDRNRRNLLPLQVVEVDLTGPDFATLTAIHERVRTVFEKALPEHADLATRFACIVGEAVDNAVTYGNGGLLAGLYYPRVGEVEITLANRGAGFGGETAEEQLEALLTACETSQRPEGGGNGIREMSELTMRCFGTLLLCNGAAALRFLPDGSVVAATEETGLPYKGASVTILLQLLPDPSRGDTDTLVMREFGEVLKVSLDSYRVRQGATHDHHQ